MPLNILPQEEIQTKTLYIEGQVDLVGQLEVNPEEKIWSHYYTKREVDEKLSILGDETVPRDLSVLPQTSTNTSRTQQTVYINDNGTPSQTSVHNLLSKVMRTDNAQPSDMQAGEYLFKVNPMEE